MKIKFSLNTILLTLCLFSTAAFAVNPLPQHLINFTSQPGLELFKKDANTSSLKLLSHFETQKTVTYCGVASAVMILNSSDLIPPNDSQHPPYQYFNQDDFFNEKVTKIITPEIVLKKGLTLMQLSQVIQSYGLKAKPYFANELDPEKFRTLLKKAISNQQFIIANFLRSALQQQGGGHHSPIAAYDQNSDRFLILDVARYKYPAYWVKTQDLWKAVHTLDEETYRGVIIINPRKSQNNTQSVSYAKSLTL